MRFRRTIRARGRLAGVAGCVALAALMALAAVFSAHAQEPLETSAEPAADERPLVVSIAIDGPIGPATAGFVAGSLDAAAEEGAELLLILMDTPGGLDASTRDIIQTILNSPVPVATYVAPEGARAASAGTYILYASHVAAMSPATNVGAATPVPIGAGQPPSPQPRRQPLGSEPASDAPDSAESESAADAEADASADSEASDTNGSEGQADDAGAPGDAMSRKVLNDAIAFIRGLAARHGRNVDWAELAVREAASITAEEALDIGVIDLIAVDVRDLLEQADGRTVAMHEGERVLDTENARIEQREPDWKTELLAVITSPTVAYILLLIGVYGLILEGYNPGAFLPGIVGAICLLLALYAFQMLPVNYVGFGLIALGIILMIAEAFAPSFGVLGIGGVIALVIGSVILIDTDAPGFVVSRPLIGAIALASGLGMLAIIGFAVKARERPVVAGAEELVGSTGSAMEAFEREGFVFVHGERWSARSREPVREGQPVAVTGIQGLTLEVEPLEEPGVQPETSGEAP